MVENYPKYNHRKLFFYNTIMPVQIAALFVVLSITLIPDTSLAASLVESLKTNLGNKDKQITAALKWAGAIIATITLVGGFIWVMVSSRKMEALQKLIWPMIGLFGMALVPVLVSFVLDTTTG